jgi:hypothetical protein
VFIPDAWLTGGLVDIKARAEGGESEYQRRLSVNGSDDGVDSNSTTFNYLNSTSTFYWNTTTPAGDDDYSDTDDDDFSVKEVIIEPTMTFENVHALVATANTTDAAFYEVS